MPQTDLQAGMYRDSAIQDMLGRPPGWLLHSGLSCLFVVVTFVLIFAYFIPYPNKFEASFVLQTRVSPLEVKARSPLPIDSIFVATESQVRKGDTLYIHRSDGDWRPVSKLDTWLGLIEADNYNSAGGAHGAKVIDGVVRQQKALADISGRNLPLSIQGKVTDLEMLLFSRASYLLTNGTQDFVNSMKEEMARTRELSSSVKRQVELYNQELALVERQRERMEDLAAAGSVSKVEAETALGSEVHAKRQREGIVSSNIQNALRVSQLEQQILERQQQHRERKAEFERHILGKLAEIRTAINAYNENHLVKADESGKIEWQPTVRDNITVAGGDLLGYLLPNDHDEEKIIARLFLPEVGQGELELGQEVMLDFAGYPAREYGQLRGQLSFIAPVATPTKEGGFVRMAEVAIPASLTTSYGRIIPFQYNLSGTARVITEDHTLLSRLFNHFTNFSKNT